MKTNLLKFTAFLLIVAGCIFSCKDKENLFLEIDETTIPAAAGAGTYSIAVSSNDRWTAIVKDAGNHTWCTLDNASGTNDGIIIVNIAENLLFTARSATVEITLGNLTKSVQFDQEAVKPCDCIMDTLRGEWSWWATLRGGAVGGAEDNEFISVIKILRQNEDESINYEVFAADTLFYKGSFQLHPAWSWLPALGVANIKLPHGDLSFTDYGVVFEIALDRKNLMFCLPVIAPRCYVYEKIERK